MSMYQNYSITNHKGIAMNYKSEMLPATADREEPQVQRVMSNLIGRIGMMADLLGMLEQRLTPVLRPEPLSKNESAPTPSLVPLALCIDEQVSALDVYNRRLQSLIDRLELT